MEKKTKATEVKKDAALEESFAEIKKAVAETAKAAEKKAAPAKEAVKAEAPKKETAAEKKTAPVKKTAPAKKTVEKKPAEKKTAPAKAEVKTAVTLQIDGRDFDPAKIIADAQKAAEKIKKDVKDVHVYINVNDQAAYFTVDGEGKPEYRVNL